MTPDELDHTKLGFGKYRDKTPDQISQSDPHYIVWLYENVTNKPTCSHLLYSECGGQRIDKDSKYNPRVETGTSMKIKDHFDSYDDDIPF